MLEATNFNLETGELRTKTLTPAEAATLSEMVELSLLDRQLEQPDDDFVCPGCDTCNACFDCGYTHDNDEPCPQD